MTSTKLTSLLALIVVLALTLTACTSDSTNGRRVGIKTDSLGDLSELSIDDFVFADIEHATATINFKDATPSDKPYTLSISTIDEGDANNSITFTDIEIEPGDPFQIELDMKEYLSHMGLPNEVMRAFFFKFEVTEQCGTANCDYISQERFIGGHIRSSPASETRSSSPSVPCPMITMLCLTKSSSPSIRPPDKKPNGHFLLAKNITSARFILKRFSYRRTRTSKSESNDSLFSI